MTKFSHRMGLGKRAGRPIDDDAPKTLRVGLAEIFDDYVSKKVISHMTIYRCACRCTGEFPDESVWSEEYERRAWEGLLAAAAWHNVYEMVEGVYQRLSPTWPDIDDDERRLPHYYFTVEVNALLEHENIAFELRQGKFVRRQAKEVGVLVAEAERLMAGPFDEPLVQFKKAQEFLAKRPHPDLENAIKDAVGALEAVAKIVTESPNTTLGEGKLQARLEKLGVHKGLVVLLNKLYALRGSEPGVAHGRHRAPEISVEDAQTVLNLCAVFVADLCRRAGSDARSTTPVKSSTEVDDEEIPF